MISRSELDLVRRIRQRAGSAPGLELGIGDDCAIYQPRSGEELLFTTDMLIEDVHFRRDTHSAGDIGHKALARGLSDIAAMGGEPRFTLLSLAIPTWADDRWVDQFFAGLLRLARRWNVALAGGDLSHSEKLASDIVVCGATPRGKALRRSGAKVGDAIYVSGRLGRDWRTHRRPIPRIEYGIELRGRATSAMDLSDGLSLDLYRLASESGVAAELDRVPVRAGSTVEQALHGGEDYELLFTMPPRRRAPKCAIRIGEIVDGPAGVVQLQGALLEARGYDHFRK